MKIKIQEADRPNKNNRVYPKNLLEKEAVRWTKTFVNENRAFLTKQPSSDGSVNLKDVVGQITSIAVEDNALVAEMIPLNVPGAEEVFRLIDEGKLCARMAGVGTLTKQFDETYLVGDDWELTSLFLTSVPA